MRTRNIVFGSAVAGILLFCSAGSASANVEWCSGDPPIKVVTPGGNNLMVNSKVYVPDNFQQTGNNSSQADYATAAPDGNGGTLITVHIFVPAGVQAHVVSSVNRFGVTSQADGADVITLRLDVPIN